MKGKKASLSHRILKSHFFGECVASFIKGLVALISKTLRWDIKGFENLAPYLHNNSQAPLIIVLWHSDLFLLPPLYRKIFQKRPASILISKSRDGAIPTLLAQKYENTSVVRVGHLLRHEALKIALEKLADGRCLVITPDGPRGPANRVKGGAIFAAKKSGIPIFPLSWNASGTIRLSSWDRFKIPLFFSRISCQIKAPIQIPRDMEDSLAQKLVEQALGCDDTR